MTYNEKSYLYLFLLMTTVLTLIGVNQAIGFTYTYFSANIVEKHLIGRSSTPTIYFDRNGSAQEANASMEDFISVAEGSQGCFKESTSKLVNNSSYWLQYKGDCRNAN